MPTADPQTRRWFHLTPGHFVLALLAVEFLLFLSQRFRWLPKGWPVLIAVASVGAFVLAMSLWLGVALVFRQKFQFSIMSLLILVVVVALPCSWMPVEMKKAREQKAAVEGIGQLDGQVTYDYASPRLDSTTMNQPEPSGWLWLRNLLEDDFFNDVVQANLSSDAELECLKGLTQLKELHLGNSQITDAGLQHIQGLTRLELLDLTNTQATDAGLAHLEGLTTVEVLGLGNTQITDAGLPHLAGLAQLKELDLDHTRTTDEGLQLITGLSRLDALQLDGTQVTDLGLAHIKGLTQLARLSLDFTQITDAGLIPIEVLTKLEHLSARNSKVTAAGVAKLQEILLGCDIAGPRHPFEKNADDGVE